MKDKVFTNLNVKVVRKWSIYARYDGNLVEERCSLSTGSLFTFVIRHQNYGNERKSSAHARTGLKVVIHTLRNITLGEL